MMDLDKLFSKILDDLEADAVAITADDLKSQFESLKAQESAKIVNNLFAKHQLKDENGNLLQVADPSDIAGAVVIENNQIKIKLTDDQVRFLKADLLYGLRAIDLTFYER